MNETAGEARARRAMRRNRIVGVAVTAVLFASGGFSVWTARDTSAAAATAVTATRLSDDYRAAEQWIAKQESLEREYRLEPSVPVRGDFEVASDGLNTALKTVHRDGDANDRAIVAEALAEHQEYVLAARLLFTVVDQGDTDRIEKLDVERVEPAFGVVSSSVQHAAAVQQVTAAAALEHLREVEALNRRVSPLVFAVTVALIAALFGVARRQSRLLGTERAQAVHASLHDALTGLANRTLFADRVEHALRTAERDRSHLAVLLIDLDRFKEINDTFGHHYGDELLIEVGRRLVVCLRAVDTVARLGGDEFAVLLPGVDTPEGALQVARKIGRALETSFDIDGIDLDVEASIGVAHTSETPPDQAADFSTLSQHADAAMYAAKTRGQGVALYQADAHTPSPATLTLLGDLRRALDRGELFLHYQPKLAIDPNAATRATGATRVVGVEALLRWRHPRTGMVPPDEFIPLAEHTGLIGPLTRHVLDQAIGCAKTWAEAGTPIPVAVNLSARNLLDDQLPQQITALLTQHDLPPELLHLEVTESAIMTEQARAAKLLGDLSALGIRISIDDFGAGYTSLGQLRHLPVHELKIDKSFVLGMADDRANDTIVRSVIELGHNLGLTIVAEGVETQEALTALAGYGCDIAQGYFFTRPLPLADLNAWLAEFADEVIPAPRFP